MTKRLTRRQWHAQLASMDAALRCPICKRAMHGATVVLIGGEKETRFCSEECCAIAQERAAGEAKR